MPRGQWARPSLAERFSERFIPEPNSGCWLWDGALNHHGYGQLSQTCGRPVKAHRVSYELSCGPIPQGMHVCHHCDVRSCVNPDHLFLGTQADNMLDMKKKGRAFRPGAGRTHCKHGHELTPETTWIRRLPGGQAGLMCRACCADRKRRYLNKIRNRS